MDNNWKDLLTLKKKQDNNGVVPQLPESQTDAMRDWYADMDTVSWIHPFLAVTSQQGASRVKDAVIINVAEELNTKADIKLPIIPEDGQDLVMDRLDMLGEIISTHINNGNKVVVHCRAGIERSALTVAWFLKNHLMFNTLDNAYAHLKKVRPIVARRDWWVEGDTPDNAPYWGGNVMEKINKEKN